MKLEKYIAQLLYRYECVTIPEFGSFLTEVRPARLQPNTYTFYPPKKVVSFNSLLRKNDGLLIHHISQSAKIPYNEAVNLLQQEVSRWKKTLESNQLLELKNIGEIHLNAENNLVFTASENANYLPDSFGLSAVVSPVIRRNYIQEVASEEINKPEITVDQTPKVIPITKAKSKTPFIKYGVAAAVIIGAGLFFANNYHQNQVAQQTLLVEQAVQQEIENKIQEATFVLENPNTTPVTLTVKEEKLHYHIVAGAFREEANAEKAFKELSEQGFKSRKLEKNKYGLYPVLFGSYTTYEEAQQNLREIRKINADAWLLVQEI
ncbi:MAG: SPOR domain-containing protein [Flavobacteriaceae bacterium]